VQIDFTDTKRKNLSTPIKICLAGVMITVFVGTMIRGKIEPAWLLSPAHMLLAGAQTVKQVICRQNSKTSGQLEARIDSQAIDAGADEAWIKQAIEHIKNQEYEVTKNAAGRLQAPNRKQNLRAIFEPRGVIIEPRIKASKTGMAKWEWQWQSKEIGRLGSMQSIEPVEPQAKGRRVEYVRRELTEWYENQPEGVEQGFIIHQRPENVRAGLSACAKQSSLVQIISQPIEGLSVRLSEDKKSIEFFDCHQVKVLEYSQLVVKDQEGKMLWSEVQVKNKQIMLVYDDQDAVYPVYIDPLLSSPGWTAESNQTYAYFGCSVGSAGDVNGDGYSDVIVGAYTYENGETDEGRAYVYHGSAFGLATASAWTAESNQASARFSYCVAGVGDVNADGYGDVIISAPYYDTGLSDIGRVYVFHGHETGLSSGADRILEGSVTNELFGWSAATAGDVNGDGYCDIIVGAPQYSNGETHDGRVYVFYGTANGIKCWLCLDSGKQSGRSRNGLLCGWCRRCEWGWIQ